MFVQHVQFVIQLLVSPSDVQTICNTVASLSLFSLKIGHQLLENKVNREEIRAKRWNEK